jgi:hypothetical protein
VYNNAPLFFLIWKYLEVFSGSFCSDEVVAQEEIVNALLFPRSVE